MIASLGLGLAIPVARLAFEGGTNGLSVSFARAVVGSGMLGIWCLMLGKRLTVSWRHWLHLVGLGVLLAHMNYGNIGAVAYIPVTVGALLFFAYPPMAVILAAVIDRRWPGTLRSIAVIGAFIGLAIMLGVGSVDGEDLDIRGIAIALSAALACALNITWISRTLAGTDALVNIFHMSVVAAVTLGLLTTATGELALPVTNMGWYGAIAVVLLQALGLPFFYAAVDRIGPERAGVTNNLQPVTSIAAAYLLFAESLTPERWAGAILVIGGIILMQWASIRERRR